MLTAGRVVGGLVLLKAVDLVGAQPLALAAFAAGGLLLLSGREAWPLVLAAGLAVLATEPVELMRQHLVLLVGVALVGTVARDDRTRLLLWRTQLSALYGFSVLAKLNEAFLSGTVLAEALRPPLPLPALLLLGLALLVVEALLAVTPWLPRLRTPGTALAAGLHGVALLAVTGGTPVVLRLLVFGGAAVLLHAVSAGLVPVRRSGSPRP